jgi:hypothetical protein
MLDLLNAQIEDNIGALKDLREKTAIRKNVPMLSMTKMTAGLGDVRHRLEKLLILPFGDWMTDGEWEQQDKEKALQEEKAAKQGAD